MAGMGDESAHHGAMEMRAGSLIEQVLDHDTSGTSAEPDSTPHPMLMTTRGRWRLMLHGVGFLSAIQQSGARGRDKIFSTNWLMPMAQREPDEYRWDIDAGKIDSWSGRLTLNPRRNWSGQYSITRLKSPEQLNPKEDVLRMTASVMYNRPLEGGNWATTLVWGRNRTLPEGEVFNGYLAESTLRFRTRNYFWGRAENVDRTSELLLGENP